MSNKNNKKNTFLKRDDQHEHSSEDNRIGDFKSLLFLLKYANSFKFHFLLAISLLLCTTLCAIQSAKIMGFLVEDGLIPKDYNQAWKIAGEILLLELLCLITQWAGRSVLVKYSLKTILNIRKGLFSHIQKLPMSYYDHQPQGRVVTRITHDVESLEIFFTGSLGRLFNALFMAIVASLAMLSTNLKLGIILISSMVPAVLFVFFTRDWVRKLNRKMSRLSSALNSRLSEFLNGLDVIRSFGLESWSKSKYDEAVGEHLKSQLAANKLFSWTRPLVSFMCSLPLIGIIYFGGKEVLLGTMSVGLFVTFIRYTERFFMPIMTLAREIHIIQQAFTSAERLTNFLQEETEESIFNDQNRNSDDIIISQKRIFGDIKFQNVSMKYAEGENVLKKLSFHIKTGEKVGLVGTTGCGKTTTVSLISRLYNFQEGEILINNIDIKLYEREYLRSKIGFVSQDAIIFRADLRENLSTNGISDDLLLDGCKKTGLLKVMNDSNMTLDTLILEGGANLSIGERQLIALTRVLLSDPSILILDEATANIDPHFEKIIHAAIDIIMEERTCLMIAHRLQTLDHCDRILVFEAGELAEEGTKEELIANKGYFFNLQQATQKKEEAL
ncbi:MAG: ABC transporter ATP-binding protein [Bacteriovoracaceae bacterium]|jgi:ATP-binding cassette, subfamily B, multidrug efflux pump|nr:ABC transporter ATP-binding protein [Bacteriovoracaceae bacterium]